MRAQVRRADPAAEYWFVEGCHILELLNEYQDSDGDLFLYGLEVLLKLDPHHVDSDCDGLLDNVEYPLSSLQPHGMDPLVPAATGSCI